MFSRDRFLPAMLGRAHQKPVWPEPGLLLTRRWREMDSNYRYRIRNNPFGCPRSVPQFAFRNKNRLFRAGDRWFESISLQQRVRRNRWLGNACGAGAMLHGAPTVHPGMAASRPLRERRLFLTDVKERCCCPYPAVARRRTQRLQSRPPQRRADDKGGKDRDASWARGVSRLKSHTTRGDAER